MHCPTVGARPGGARAPQTSELSEIEVLAKRVNARNRVDTAAPVLSYDEEYFQRFEPLSVGDMMKRVPGVSLPERHRRVRRAFAARHRQRVHAGPDQRPPHHRRTNDNTVIVDRIPAELVERVEIIRSPSSDIDSQGIGGTLNIILKEGADLSGGIYRVGVYYNRRRDEPERVPVLRRQRRAQFDWNTSVNYQERFNRKVET